MGVRQKQSQTGQREHVSHLLRTEVVQMVSQASSPILTAANGFPSLSLRRHSSHHVRCRPRLRCAGKGSEAQMGTILPEGRPWRPSVCGLRRSRLSLQGAGVFGAGKGPRRKGGLWSEQEEWGLFLFPGSSGEVCR